MYFANKICIYAYKKHINEYIDAKNIIHIYIYIYNTGSLAQWVEFSPIVWETWVQPLFTYYIYIYIYIYIHTYIFLACIYIYIYIKYINMQEICIFLHARNLYVYKYIAAKNIHTYIYIYIYIYAINMYICIHTCQKICVFMQ